MNHYKSSSKANQNLEQQEALAKMKEWLAQNSLEFPRVTHENIVQSIGNARSNIGHMLQPKAEKEPLTVEIAAKIISQQTPLTIPSNQYAEAIKKTSDFLRQHKKTIYEPGQLVYPHVHWDIMRKANMNEADIALISKALCMRGLMGNLNSKKVNETFTTLKTLSKMNEERLKKRPLEEGQLTSGELYAWSSEFPTQEDLVAPQTPYKNSSKTLIS